MCFRKIIIVLFSIFLSLSTFVAAAEMVLKNGDFQDFDVQKGIPVQWNGDSLCRCEPGEWKDEKGEAHPGLKITLVQEFRNHVSVNQMLPVEGAPKEWRLSGVITSDTPHFGYLQVKFFKNRKEIRRENSESNGHGPTPVRVVFRTEDADAILIQCRVSADAPLGTSALFSGLKLEEVLPGTFAEWHMTCGNGSVQNSEIEETVPDASVSTSLFPFRADLTRSKSERFAAVGEDYRITNRGSVEKQNTDMEFAAEIAADFVNFAYLRVELFRGGEALGEYLSPRNRWCRDTLRVCFNSKNADRAVIHVCFDGRQKFQGETASCCGFYFGPERKNFRAASAPAPELEIVPGFETAGVYLHHCTAEKAENFSASLEFRETSDDSGDSDDSETSGNPGTPGISDVWHAALAPVYIPEERCARGCVLNLKEGKKYEIRMNISDSGIEKTWKQEFRTHSAEVPILKTIELSEENCKIPFYPPETGSPETGYVRYTARPGFILDAGENADAAVLLNEKSYVILDGLTIRGGRNDGIQMYGSNHVQIQNCDIAGFSRVGIQRPEWDGKFYPEDGSKKALNNDCGIRIISCESILVERCYIHDPRGTANSWFYSHPAGPNAIFIGDTVGACIRWNDFVGSDLHRWNDTIEGKDNGSNCGSVRRDAEVYGNYLAFGNDDGMELDGGQVNCRFFRNRTEGHLCGVSTAPCKRGPTYLFQNIFCNPGDVYGLVGCGFKNNYQNIGAGATFFIHNTIYGYSTAFSSPGGTPEEYSALAESRPFKGFSRNNLSTCGSSISPSFFLNMRNDFDADLFPECCGKEIRTFQKSGQEEHAILASPVFRNETGGDYVLAENSPGKAAGQTVPNIFPYEAPTESVSPDVGALAENAGLRAIPVRPVSFYTDVMHVHLTFDGKSEPNAKRKTAQNSDSGTDSGTDSVRLTASVLVTADKNGKISGKAVNAVKFRVIQPEGAVFFRVTPSSGTVEAGKSVRLTIEALPEKITQARLNSSAFLIRTADGFSRPVSVTVDSRPNAVLAVKDRGDAVYGKILPQKDGSAELEFDVPCDGSYWLFAHGKHENCCWDSLNVDGGEALPRIPLGAKAGDDIWRCAASSVYSGSANCPLPLTAGRHILRLNPRSGRILQLEETALSANPDAFRLNPAYRQKEELPQE